MQRDELVARLLAIALSLGRLLAFLLGLRGGFGRFGAALPESEVPLRERLRFCRFCAAARCSPGRRILARLLAGGGRNGLAKRRRVLAGRGRVGVMHPALRIPPLVDVGSGRQRDEQGDDKEVDAAHRADSVKAPLTRLQRAGAICIIRFWPKGKKPCE
ncbi:hypothetical protein ebA6649 [Aromatoleum aromaticum EbN1]|uniref:Uncharacterized protein n=1 Tax=Aromatoleum aromaticum (strain DSM 19018 / LMG 30748 / EbN1) TaxID=76114 RepID=Q5NYE3_AROAE|nr:hypothetical protein ebA6649 [Aromatoleum aromaticum EbN1]